MNDPNRFQLTASPVMKRTDDGVVLDFVEFTATRGEDARSWLVAESQLATLPDVVPSSNAGNYVDELRHGRAVNFVEDFSAVHLVLLGYRILSQKAARPMSLPNGLYLAPKVRRATA